MLNDPIRLTVMVFVKTSSGCAPSRPTVFDAGAMPAQLISPISLPAPVAAETTALPSASELTSQRTNRWPSSFASVSPSSCCTSAMTTFAPLLVSMRTVPAPRPDAPPVTMKTLPSMFMRNPLSLSREGSGF